MQHTNQGHYGVYIFRGLFDASYLNLLLDKTLQLTHVDSMHNKTNVKANMTDYQALIKDPDFFFNRHNLKFSKNLHYVKNTSLEK